MAKVSMEEFSLHSAATTPVAISQSITPSQSVTTDVSVDRWLAKLLKHFSVEQLDTISTQEIAAYVSSCLSNNHLVSNSHLDSTKALSTETQNQAPQTVTLPSHVLTSDLAAELKRRVMRLAGVKLDSAFLAMASRVVDESTVEAITLPIAGRQLQGVRYQGDVYRQVSAFKLCHQLQAYCLAQTLSEQHIAYLITRSSQRFAVWVNTCTLTQQSNSALY